MCRYSVCLCHSLKCDPSFQTSPSMGRTANDAGKHAQTQDRVWEWRRLLHFFNAAEPRACTIETRHHVCQNLPRGAESSGSGTRRHTGITSRSESGSFAELEAHSPVVASMMRSGRSISGSSFLSGGYISGLVNSGDSARTLKLQRHSRKSICARFFSVALGILFLSLLAVPPARGSNDMLSISLPVVLSQTTLARA